MNKTKKRGSLRTLLLFCLLAISLVIPQGVFAEGAAVTASDLTGLKDAVANAVDGEETTITLDTNLTLEETIVIPAGKQIVLRAEGAVTLTKADAMTTPLFSVESGASLTVQDALTMDAGGKGRHIEATGALVLAGGTLTGGGNGAVKVSGATGNLTLSGTKIVDTAVTSSSNGAVLVSKGATGTMTGGSIENTALQSQCTGSLTVMDSDFVMDGGTISGATTTKWLTGGGIYVLADDAKRETHFTMNDGLVTGNNGSRGGGVRVAGGESSGPSQPQPQAYFTMNGGTISGNTATGRGESQSQGSGGGVFVLRGGHFIMNDGLITGNEANNGGGVATFDYYDYRSDFETYSQKNPAEFTMNGGTITGNRAEIVSPWGPPRGGVGGGIYVASNSVTLVAGNITDNIAETQGGGIYVSTQPYTLHLTKTLITQNHADFLGGGIWLCPTGTLQILINDGAAIFDNEADAVNGLGRMDASGDDLTILSDDDHKVTMTDRMLGGGKALWYEDGTNDDDGQLGYALNNSEADRYQADNPGKAWTFYEESDICMSFKNVPTEGSKTNAEEMAALRITGNMASRGGGIGSNGGVVMGTDGDRNITVEKKWDLVPGSTKELPRTIWVYLYANGRYTGDRGTLDAQGDGTYSTFTFENLSLNVDYTVMEYPALDGFTASYAYAPIAGTDDMLATITNTEDRPEPPIPNTPGEPPEPPIPSTGTEKPSTGDQQEMGLWLVLLVSATLTTGSLVLRRKLTR